MSVPGGDISWQTLRRIVHDWVGAAAELDEVRPLHGGSISATLALKTRRGDRAVVKLTEHRVDRRYVHEAYQLNVLRAIGVPTPRVYSCKIGSLDEPVSYLLIEYLDGIDLSQAKRQLSPSDFDHAQMHLAELLLRIHEQTHSHFTRLNEGHREEFDAWPAFHRHCYEAIWREAAKVPCLPIKTRKLLGRLHDRLESVLAHDDCPRLIHGDAWANNFLASRDHHGKWWVTGVLDPMCKYAHVEAELAYLDLFHTVTPAFFRAYQARRKLPPEYHAVRKPVYQAYELMNHLQLFGQEYLKPLLAVADKLVHIV